MIIYQRPAFVRALKKLPMRQQELSGNTPGRRRKSLVIPIFTRAWDFALLGDIGIQDGIAFALSVSP